MAAGQVRSAVAAHLAPALPHRAVGRIDDALDALVAGVRP
jgi:hypothetical protein